MDCDDVADLTDPATSAGLGVDPADLAGVWEDDASGRRVPQSWALAKRLIASGTAAIIVPCRATRRPYTNRLKVRRF